MLFEYEPLRLDDEPALNKRRVPFLVKFLSLLIIGSSILWSGFHLLKLNRDGPCATMHRFGDCSGGAGSCTANAKDGAPIRDVLPDCVKPTHYDLTIDTCLETFTFSGRSVIALDVRTSGVRSITLNSKDLVLSLADFSTPKGLSLSADRIEYNEQREEATIHFPSELAKGIASLSVSFTGSINDKMAGFYRSKFTNLLGKEEFMAVTQFEPTDARRAFPCWDEPNAKATFSITLIVDGRYTALSNMNVVSESLSGSRKTVSFAKTPIMSTYLIAFVVGALEFVEATNQNGTLVRVYAPPGLSQQGKFALECGTKTLDFFTKYFDTPYPLPKMDMVAIPDFGSGAMENWGLVTYRTVYLLYDEENSSTKTKQNIAYVVGHELAHQWFGNLVTMDWWTDLWLNEGFATWVGTLAADFLFPEWNSWREFIVDDHASGLKLDALRSSHPIEVDVRNPAEINQIFDAISYSKGAAVIRMLVSYLGEADFKSGMQSYLRKHMYGNATTNDLWHSLGEASGKPVNEIMTSWTRQIGYPVLHVTRASSTTLKLCQQRYLSAGDVKEEDDQCLWWIPLRMALFDGSRQQPSIRNDIQSKKEASIEIDPRVTFFKFNFGTTGFFRVSYPEQDFKHLSSAISRGILSAEDRIGLLNDAFSLAYSGNHSLTVPLSLLESFRDESDYLVWSEISTHLSLLHSIWWEQPIEIRNKISSLIRHLCQKPLKVLGFEPAEEGEPEITGLLRALIIGLAGRHNDQGVIAEAKERFSDFLQGKTGRIHPNLRGTVFGIVVRSGGVAEFDAVFNLYRTMTTVDQKLHALRALGTSRDLSVLEKALSLVFTEHVRQQDVTYVISVVGANSAGRRLAWKFVMENWSRLYESYNRGSISILSNIVSGTTQHFTQDQDAEAVENFFLGKEVSSLTRSISQSLEKIKASSKLLQRDCMNVRNWLFSQNQF